MNTSSPDSIRPIYLNGEWRTSSPALEVINPSTGEVFAQVSTIDREGTRQAIADADAAWQGWRDLTGKERGAYLHAIADGIEKRADEIAHTISLENGKPLAQGKGEVGMTVDHFRWFAEEARRTYGRVIPHQMPGKRHLVIRQSVGVVGAIAPWNFPLVLAVRKVAPALAAGCPVLLKPASATPLSSLLLAEAVHEAGLPKGVFQLLIGKAREIGAELMENPACRKITFTGSTEVGRELIRQSADQVKKLSMELGGHAPLIIFDDANLDTAIEGALITKFRNGGQSCIASNRIYVQAGIYEKFLEAFVKKTQALKIGDGLTDGIDIGPLIDSAAVDTALKHIEAATASGARLLCGGKRPEGFNDSFLEATVLADVPEDTLCMNEETFAPVAPVSVFDHEDEVIQRANDTDYGLAAYVFTENLNRAWRVAEALEAGTVGVNDAVPSTSQCPFGGIKQSGLGRELGSEGIDGFLESKHISFGGIG
ncbi:MAG: NAD-dependent succinate-semialdehyde dehydrogenase [Verrucomicrobiales bacterium]|nr:NAD-dependent succinate-semialdehyde dehydrogenase [Verrucomicrobiales bacterium]